jgi:hypothetical protein
MYQCVRILPPFPKHDNSLFKTPTKPTHTKVWGLRGSPYLLQQKARPPRLPSSKDDQEQYTRSNASELFASQLRLVGLASIIHFATGYTIFSINCILDAIRPTVSSCPKEENSSKVNWQVHIVASQIFNASVAIGMQRSIFLRRFK